MSSGTAMSTEAEEDGRRVREAGFKFYGDRYFQQFSALREVVVDWIAGFIDDEVNDRVWKAWRTIWRDLFYSGGDEETGQSAELTFKRQMWVGVVKAIVPILVAQLDTVPIPRVELSTQTFDLVLENILLKIDALLPRSIAIEAHNSLSFSPWSTAPEPSSTSSQSTHRYTHYDERKHEFKVTLEGINIDIKNVGVFMRKKRKERVIILPIPKEVRNRVIEESLVDLAVDDEGITIMAHIVFNRRATDPRTKFSVKDVHVSIPDVKLALRDLPPPGPILHGDKLTNTNKLHPHTSFVRVRGKSVLRRTFKSIAVAIVKRKMKKALEEAVRDGMTRLYCRVLDSASAEALCEDHEMDNSRGDERLSASPSSTASDRSSGSDDEIGPGDGKHRTEKRKKVRVVLRKDDMEMKWELGEGPFQHSGYESSKGGDKWRSNAFSIAKR